MTGTLTTATLTAPAEAAANAVFDSDAIEVLDEATVTTLLTFRYRYLVDAGFPYARALMLAVDTNISLHEVVTRFNLRVGVAGTR